MERYIYSSGEFINVGNANWVEWQLNQLKFRFQEKKRVENRLPCMTPPVIYG